MRSRIVAGPLVAAAMLALLALAPARPQERDLPHLRPWRPTVAQRFAAAMQASQHDLSRVTYHAGEITALVRVGAPDQLPRLRVDAAIAASRVRHTCGCVLAGYRVMTDRFGPDPILVASGRALPVAPSGPGWRARNWTAQEDEWVRTLPARVDGLGTEASRHRQRQPGAKREYEHGEKAKRFLFEHHAQSNAHILTKRIEYHNFLTSCSARPPNRLAVG